MALKGWLIGGLMVSILVCGLGAVAGLVFLGPRLLRGGGPKVPAERSAERVLAGLRDGDYAAAQRALATGRAGRLFANAAALQAAAEGVGVRPARWTWQPLQYASRERVDARRTGSSYVIAVADVVLADGRLARARFELEALGMADDPWRIEAFSMEPVAPARPER